MTCEKASVSVSVSVSALLLAPVCLSVCLSVCLFAEHTNTNTASCLTHASAGQWERGGESGREGGSK